MLLPQPRMTRRSYGRYETLHRIASGGMASVFLGRHVGAGGFERLVAIKVMHDHIAEEPSFSTMFLDEARLAAQIRHPNVVPTLDVADDGRYIVMEYVEGASLQAILTARRKSRAPLPVPVALRIFLDALAGLHAAHELTDMRGQPLNLVHRDVSPHNLLVGVDGMSRITDFGIAYAEARLTSTRSGQLKGKLPYMSPEQLEDAPITRTTDVYAAGCVLWEMLTGKRLFTGSNEAAVACAVLAGPEQTVRDLRPEVPEPIDRACMQAIQRDGARYASALVFAEALELAAEASGVRIAKHREVGPVAQLEKMTYPAASTFGESDEDPRPKELLAALGDAAPPTRRVGEEAGPATVGPSTVGPSTGAPATIASASVAPSTVAPATVAEPAVNTPILGSSTMVTPGAAEEGSAAAPPRFPAVDVVVPGRTTMHDRPPPEVAAVLRAAYAIELGPSAGEEHAGAEEEPTVSPVSRGGSDFDDTSVVIPKQRAWTSVAAVALLTAGLGAGVFWAATRGETSPSAAPERPAVTTAPVPSAAPIAPTAVAHVTAATVATAAAASSSPPTADPPPAPSFRLQPTRTTSQPPSLPAPTPTPTPTPPSPSPAEPRGEYHPDAP